MYCFLKLAICNPGYYSNDYFELFSVLRYNERYINFIKQITNNFQSNIENREAEFQTENKIHNDSYVSENR
jgi:hypothetical protein